MGMCNGRWVVKVHGEQHTHHENGDILDGKKKTIFQAVRIESPSPDQNFAKGELVQGTQLTGIGAKPDELIKRRRRHLVCAVRQYESGSEFRSVTVQSFGFQWEFSCGRSERVCGSDIGGIQH
jgi:hypothetical protein